MILRPVTPESPIGPPIDEAAGGVDEELGLLVDQSTSAATFAITSSRTASWIFLFETSSECWVETTTASIRDRLAVDVLDGDLALAVGAEPVVRLPADVGEPLGEQVRVGDRRRHQLGGLVAGVAEHHPLVAGALLLLRLGVDAAGDVRRLPLDRDQHAAGVAVEAHLASRCSRSRRSCSGRSSGCRRSSWWSPRRRRSRGRSSPASRPRRRALGSCARIASSTPSEI